MPVPSQRLALAIAASAAQAVASAQPSEASEAATPIGAQVVAGLQAAPLLPRITVSAKGYRAANRYIVFQVLPHTLGLGPEVWRVLDLCHNKRNLGEYEGLLEVDERLVKDLIVAVQRVDEALAAQ